MLWDEVMSMQTEQQRQRQNLSKLVQFLISLVRPQKRMGKRIVPIDEHNCSSNPNGARSLALLQNTQNSDILDFIQKDLTTGLHISPPSSLYKRSPGATAQRILRRQTSPKRSFVDESVEHKHNTKSTFQTHPKDSNSSLARCPPKVVAVRSCKSPVFLNSHHLENQAYLLQRSIDGCTESHECAPSTSNELLRKRISHIDTNMDLHGDIDWSDDEGERSLNYAMSADDDWNAMEVLENATMEDQSLLDDCHAAFDYGSPPLAQNEPRRLVQSWRNG
jgi:hypothetical protein